MLKKFCLQLGKAGVAASSFDILNLDIINGGPLYCYSLTVSASFRFSSIFAWRRLCQSQITCTQSETLVHINSLLQGFSAFFIIPHPFPIFYTRVRNGVKMTPSANFLVHIFSLACFHGKSSRDFSSFVGPSTLLKCRDFLSALKMIFLIVASNPRRSHFDSS